MSPPIVCNLLKEDVFGFLGMFDDSFFTHLYESGPDILINAIADFPGGELDPNGYVIAADYTKNQINLNYEEILNFSKSNQLVLDVTLNTDENQSIRLYADYEFIVNMGMQIKLNLDE